MEATKMTASQIKRLHGALAEYDRFINKEEARNPALRPADIAALLALYKVRRAEVAAAIAGVAA